MNDYSKVVTEPCIYRYTSSKGEVTYAVWVLRRRLSPKTVKLAGGLATLEEARKVRDDYAALHPKAKVGPAKGQYKVFHDGLTTAQRRKSLGLCPSCGSPDRHAFVHCQSCRNALKELRKIGRKT